MDNFWLQLAIGAVAWHLTFGLLFVIYCLANGIMTNTTWPRKLLILAMIVIWPSYVHASLADDMTTWGTNADWEE